MRRFRRLLKRGLIANLLVIPAFSADIFCGPSNTGSGNGSDLNNRMQLPTGTGWDRANRYICIEGTYGDRTFSEALSGGTVITVEMLDSSFSGVAGYSSTLHDGPANLGDIDFATGNWILDGKTGGGPGNNRAAWTTGFGFVFTVTNSDEIIWNDAPSGTITIRHFKTVGAGDNGLGGGDGNDSVKSEGQAHLILEHFDLTESGRCHFFHGGGPITARWGFLEEFEGSVEGEHGEIAVLRTPSIFTLEYSIIIHQEGTGGIISANDTPADGIATAHLNGNVWYASEEFGDTWSEGNGTIASFTSNAWMRGWRIIHNTFINVPVVYGDDGESPLDNIAKNNLYYLSSNTSVGGAWTQTHGHWASGATSGSNATSGGGDMFFDYTNFDFRLETDTTDGDLTVGSPFDTDMFGTTRTGTRGAIDIASNDDLFTGLVSHWPFEESAGGPWVDAEGTNDFTLVSGTSFSGTGKINNAIDLDAASVAIITVADNASISFTTEFTISAWIRLEALTANLGILGKWNYSSDGGWVFQTDSVDGNGLMCFVATAAGDTGETWLRWTDVGHVVDTWYHVVLVYDGAETGNAGRMKAYNNGSLLTISAENGTIPATLQNDSSPLRLGMFGTGLARHFNGRIDEMRLWNRALTAGEVIELYTLENIDGGEESNNFSSGISGNAKLSGNAGLVRQ